MNRLIEREGAGHRRIERGHDGFGDSFGYGCGDGDGNGHGHGNGDGAGRGDSDGAGNGDVSTKPTTPDDLLALSLQLREAP